MIDTKRQTHRLTLRPWQLTDAPRLYEILQHVESKDYMPLPSFRNAVEARDYIISSLSNRTQFAVANRDTNELVGGGMVAVKPNSDEMPAEGADAFLDFWIAPDQQHQNLGDEVVEAVLEASFTTLRVRSLWCRAIAANYAAHNILMAHGFLPAVDYSRTFASDAESAVDILYITADDWAALWGIIQNNKE